MSEDIYKDSAIIPEETDRKLFLPTEMISRGLELAMQIEQKQSIQAVEQSLARGDAIIRGYASKVEFLRMPDGKIKYKELNERESKQPVYLVLTVEKDGILLSCVPSWQYSFLGIQDNEARFRALKISHNLEPLKIPMASLHLFYLIIKEQGNFMLRQGPPNWPGYPGAIPTSRQTRDPLSFPGEGEAIEIVIIFTHQVREDNQSKGLVPVTPYQKITFFAINEKGQNDLLASRSLYNGLLEAKEKAKQVKSG